MVILVSGNNNKNMKTHEIFVGVTMVIYGVYLCLMTCPLALCYGYIFTLITVYDSFNFSYKRTYCSKKNMFLRDGAILYTFTNLATYTILYIFLLHCMHILNKKNVLTNLAIRMRY